MNTQRELDAITSQLGDDERAVLVLLARRLLDGQKHNGELHVAADGRDWRKEMRDEALDLVVYRAIAQLAGATVDTGDALTRTQARCNELIAEVRTLRAQRDAAE